MRSISAVDELEAGYSDHTISLLGWTQRAFHIVDPGRRTADRAVLVVNPRRGDGVAEKLKGRANRAYEHSPFRYDRRRPSSGRCARWTLPRGLRCRGRVPRRAAWASPSERDVVFVTCRGVWCCCGPRGRRGRVSVGGLAREDAIASLQDQLSKLCRAARGRLRPLLSCELSDGSVPAVARRQ